MAGVKCQDVAEEQKDFTCAQKWPRCFIWWYDSNKLKIIANLFLYLEEKI